MEWLIAFVQGSPLLSIIAFSLAITAALSLLYKVLINQKELEKLKRRQKELRNEATQARNDPKKLAEVQKEMMAVSMASMKLTFKPMMITLVPMLFVFWGLKKLYIDAAGIGNIIAWPWNLPLIGNGAGWLLCYIIFSLVFSFVLRKAFKLY